MFPFESAADDQTNKSLPLSLNNSSMWEPGSIGLLCKVKERRLLHRESPQTSPTFKFLFAYLLPEKLLNRSASPRTVPRLHCRLLVFFMVLYLLLPLSALALQYPHYSVSAFHYDQQVNSKAVHPVTTYWVGTVAQARIRPRVTLFFPV